MALHVHNLYFFTKFKVDLKPAVDAFKAARLFWPQKINDLNPDSEAIDSLRAFPFLQDQVLLSNLKAELPHYLASTVDLAVNVDPLDWWSHHTETLPYWSATASLVMLFQPQRLQNKCSLYSQVNVGMLPYMTILKLH